jgi:hypothetical protein
MPSTEMNPKNRIYLELNSKKEEDIMFVLQVSQARFQELKEMANHNIYKLLYLNRIGCNVQDPNLDFLLSPLLEDDD